MKRSLLLTTLALLTAVTAAAYDFSAKNSDGVSIYYAKNGDGATVSVTDNGDFNTYSGVVAIPSTASDGTTTYDVTAIGEEAFNQCENLIEVEIPTSVTTIGRYAFDTCTSLTDITIPSSVTTVGEGAFSGCSAIKSLKVPDSVTYIGPSAFSMCLSLETIKLSGSITEVGQNMFWGCEKLKRLDIPYSVTSIGKDACLGCTSMTYVYIPRFVTSIGETAFAWCSSLKDITIKTTPWDFTWGADIFLEVPVESCKLYVPNGTQSRFYDSNQWDEFQNVLGLPNYDFKATVDGQEFCCFFDYGRQAVSITYNTYESSYKKSDITVPAYVTYDGNTYPVAGIGESAFKNSTVQNLTLPNTITHIDKYAFSNCTNLSRLYLPASVETIMGGSFENCAVLSEVYLPKSIRSLNTGAFRQCSNVAKVEIRVTDPNDITVTGAAGDINFPDVNFNVCQLYVPSSSFSLYKAADEWNSFKNIYFLPHYDFSAQSDDNYIYYTIDTPSEVTVTYKNTDYNNYSGSVNIPAEVTNEGITYTVTKIDDQAFYKCNSLTAITIPFGVTSIGPNAFSYCSKLTAFEMPNTVTTIGDEAFSYCTKLQTVTLSEMLTAISNRAFHYCSAMSEITIPESVIEIMEEAFGYCTGLRSITELSPSPVYVLLRPNVFLDVPTDLCRLIVPDGTKYMYEKALQWEDFTTILEISEAGIDGVINDSAVHDNIYYDLYGRRVANPTSGIYILNGHKVLVR